MGAAHSHAVSPGRAPPPSLSPSPSTPADPRSPTLRFDRTPIQKASSAPVSPITKNVNLNKECFEKFDNMNLDSPSVRNILNQFDPRSPALAFQRTPLSFIINNPALLSEYNRAARSKRLDDSAASNDLFDNSTTDVEEHKNDLHYRTPVPDEIEKVGLLETNLDFIETDIDEARKIRRSLASSRARVEPPVDNVVEEKDPRSPTVGIDRTPIVLPMKDELEEKEEKAVLDELDEQVKELQKVNKEMHPRNKNIINKNKDVLIYEDAAETIVTPTVKLNSNIQNTEKTRTPLSCVMNTENGLPKSRSNTPLSTYDKDSKSSTKSRNGVKSKIPIKIQNASSKRCEMRKTLLDKIPKNEQTFNRRIMDSENSPPIPRKARWDHDKTVVL